jgi:hypothetical protein
MSKRKKQNVTNATITDLLSILTDWENIAFNNEDEFLRQFCHNAWILTKISWCSDSVMFEYVLDEGQHVSDSTPISKWIEFVTSVTAQDRLPKQHQKNKERRLKQ